MTGKLFAVTFDCADAAKLVGFWAQALGQELTGLGATLVNEAYLPPIRLTVFADPEGNRFQLATWQSE